MMLMYVGDAYFHRTETCYFLLDGRLREKLSSLQRSYHPAGLDGEPTETLVYDVTPEIVQRLCDATTIEGRVGDLEFSIPKSQQEIIVGYSRQLLG
jgi:hypothetical protein